MKIITRYIAFEYIKGFIFSLFFLTILYSSVDMVQDLDDIFKKDASFAASFQYFLYQIPIHLNEIFPFITLISLVISIGMMSYRNEILIMLTSGVSRYFIFKPIFFILIFLYVFDIYLGEIIVPDLSQKVKYIWKVLIKKKASFSITKNKDVWLKGQGNIFYNIGLYDSEARIMENVLIFKVNKDNTNITQQIDAREAVWLKGDKWKFFDGTVWNISNDGKISGFEKFKSKVIPLEENLYIFLSISKNPENMNFFELRKYLSAIKNRRTKIMRLYEFTLHKKLAQPLAVFILCFAVFPLLLMANKNGYFYTISIGIFYAIFYYALMAGVHFFTKYDFFNPVFLAWFPDILYTCLGFYNFKKVFL